MVHDDNIFTGGLAKRRPLTGWLYFTRFLRHPIRLASLVPSSPNLGRLVASEVRRVPGEYVIELGAGTGAITAELLAGGVPASQLVSVEIDGDMADYLRAVYPDVSVVEADAVDLPKILPETVVGRVGTVVCGIPVSLLPLEEQRALVEVMLALMPAGHRFLIYSHRLTSPLPAGELGLVGERLGMTWRNVPPASVWGFSRRNAE
jgi:phosphatidylethanolamine/phosphatidyl-N-methylethanolamine N-methyltransferase